MLALEVLEGTMYGEFRQELRGGAGGYEYESALLDSLQKELQGLGTLDAGAGVLDDDDVVGGGATVARAEGQAGNGIGSDNELALFERVEAGINRGGIAMDEEDVERTAPVRGRSAEWAHSRQIRLGIAVSGVGHRSLTEDWRCARDRENAEGSGSANPTWNDRRRCQRSLYKSGQLWKLEYSKKGRKRQVDRYPGGK